MRATYFAATASLLLIASACATVPNEQMDGGRLTVLLAPDQQAITDVEGPYSAVSLKTHQVAVRVWPDDLDDGIADASIFVTNGTWASLQLDAAAIRAASAFGNIDVLGRREMLARLSATPAESEESSAPDRRRATNEMVTRNIRSPVGEAGGPRMDASLSEAPISGNISGVTSRASASRRREATRSTSSDPVERREAIEAWYLDKVEVYPGDTGMGGISFALPPGNGVIELEVNAGTESHVFALQYENAL